MTIKIKIDTIEKVKEFVKISMVVPEDLNVKAGRFIVDAKSLMGLFSVDLTKPLLLEIPGCSERSYEIAGLFKDFLV